MPYLKLIDNFKAEIVGNYGVADTAIEISAEPSTITSFYMVVYDFDGEILEEIKVSSFTGTEMTCVRGLSFVTNSDTPVAGNAKELQNGMQVKLAVSQHYMNDFVDVINGDQPFGGTPYLPEPRTITNARDIIDKEYADAIATTGVTPFATTYGGSGLAVTINSGYYIKNGEVLQYAGATPTLADDKAAIYLELVDGVLVTDNYTGFSDDALPIAKITTSSGAVTVVEDDRAFCSLMDLVSASSAYLTGDTGAESTYTVYTALTNTGKFNMTIDGIEYEDINPDFTGDTDMDDVATSIQVAIRAATSGSEIVAWDTDHFVITSGKTGSGSEIDYGVAPTDGGAVDLASSTYLDVKTGGSVAKTAGTDGSMMSRGASGLEFLNNLSVKMDDTWRFADLIVSDDARLTNLYLNAVQLTATATEINQALDGISVNVTDTNLNTVLGGGNADTLHTHSVSDIGVVSASDDLKASADTEESFTNTSYAEKKAILIPACVGNIRVKFDLKEDGSNTALAKIYINGVATGTERTDTTGTYVNFSEDITISNVTDVNSPITKVSLYVKIGSSTTGYVRNFRIYYGKTNSSLPYTLDS